ncbi:hypothetical protein FOZ61_001060, partial [Perkinsus olseni]
NVAVLMMCKQRLRKFQRAPAVTAAAAAAAVIVMVWSQRRVQRTMLSTQANSMLVMGRRRGLNPHPLTFPEALLVLLRPSAGSRALKKLPNPNTACVASSWSVVDVVMAIDANTGMYGSLGRLGRSVTTSSSLISSRRSSPRRPWIQSRTPMLRNPLDQ